MTGLGSSSGSRFRATAAVLVAVVALFFAPVFAGDRQFLYRDTGRAYYPEKRWIAEELRRGHFPEWNPYAGLGEPVLASAVASLQHPFNGLFLVLPFDAAYRLWIVLCYAMAALGMLAWTRALGCGPAGAAVAALAFTLSGFLVSSSDNLIHLATMAGAPWLLAAARSHAARGGRLRLACVLVASFLCAAGGEVLDWAVAVGLAAVQVWLPGDGAPAPRGRGWRALAEVGAAIAGAAPVLLPFLAFVPESSRGSALALEQVQRWNLHPLRVPELAIPNLVRDVYGRTRNDVYVLLTGDQMPTPWTLSLYVGAPVLALAGFGAWRGRTARVLLAVAAVAAWAAMGHHAGFGWIAGRIPVLSAVRYFERLAGWPILLIAAAAGVGVQHLLSAQGRARGLVRAAAPLGAALLLASVTATWFGEPLASSVAGAGSARPARALLDNVVAGAASAGAALAVLAGLVFLASRGRIGRTLPALLVALVTADLVGANARAYVATPVSDVFPEGAAVPPPLARGITPEVGRITAPYALDSGRWPGLLPFESSWRWGARTLAASFHEAWRVRSIDAYTGVAPARLRRFLDRAGNPGYILPAGLVGLGGVVVPDTLAAVPTLGLRPPVRLLARDPELPAWLVEVPHRPRAYLAGEVVATDADGALSFLLASVPASERRTAIEGEVPPGYGPPTSGAARVVRDDPEQVEVVVRCPSPALLVLNDQVLSGWTAEVDGRAAPIHAVNYVARGVWVEAGEHTVVFRYRTPLWRTGWLVLAAALLTLVAPVRSRHAPVNDRSPAGPRTP